MIFSQFQKEDVDNVYTMVRNIKGAALAFGVPVVLDGGSSRDGVRVTQAVTATIGLFRGVTAEAIADSAYGKVLLNGFLVDASVINTTNVIGAAGSVLYPTSGQDYLTVGLAAATGAEGLVYLMEAFTTATAGALAAAAKDIFVRAM